MANTHILVIEDDDDARMMYGVMLRSWGYDITEVTTGREGIKVAQREVPDLILLDIMMPDMDGYEVCRELRKDPRFHKVPILFLTALDGIDDRVKGYTIGGDDFITKARVDYKELGARIKAALDRSKRLAEPPAEGQNGLVLGVFSLRGGVGVSTFSVNLARYVTTVSENPVILIDLSFPVGSVSLWSGITGPQHSVSLLSRPPSEINSQLITNYSMQNVYGSYFIPGPPRIEDLSGIRIQAVDQMLNVLREDGYNVILDLGRGTLPLIWHTFARCDWIGIVTGADTISKALARVALSSLPEYDVDPRSMLLIFNDATDQQPGDLSMGLPRAPDVFIPYTKDFGDLVDPTPFARFWSLVAAEGEEVST
ncbi:MAG: response regulator [Anaerolineae bacterium]